MDNKINTKNQTEEKQPQSIEVADCAVKKRKHVSSFFSSHGSFKKFVILLICVVLYGFYYWGIPAIIDLPQRTEIIEQTISKDFGYKISIKNPTMKMGLTPSIWVKADSFKLLNDNNTSALSVDKPFIKIKLLPLIFKKIDIKNFSADNLLINLVFDKNSDLKLGQYPLNSHLEQSLKLKQAALKIGDYKINLDDQLQSKQINLNGKYLTVSSFIDGKHIDFSTLADLHIGDKTSFIQADVDLKLPLANISEDKIQLSGHVINLDLADFSVYAKSLSKNKIKSLSGVVNLTADTIDTLDNHKQIITKVVIDNLGIMQDDYAACIYFKKRLSLDADIKTIRNGIRINNFNISGEGVDAFTTGKITDLNSKTPNINLKLAVNKSRIESILPLLPGEKDLVPDVNLHLLKEKGFWGDIIGNLEIKGKSDTPNVNGSVLATHGYLLQPIVNTQGATIKLIFTDNIMDMDVNVPTGIGQNVFVKGPVQLHKGKNADLMITSAGKVDLKTAQIVLNPLHEILHFELGPVPVMDIRGKGEINLHVVGTKKNPHAWGYFAFDDASVSFLDIHNMVVKNGSGVLTFNNQNTNFKTKHGYLNGKPISISGTCSLLGILDFDVKTNGQDISDLMKIVTSSPLLKDIQKMVEPIQKANGKTNFTIKLTGQVRNPKQIVFNKNIFAKGTIDLFSNDIEIKKFPVKVLNVSGKVDFNNLDINFNLKSNINKSQISLNGKMKNMICQVQIASNRFILQDAFLILPKNIKIPYKNDLSKISTSFSAKYSGSLDVINFNDIFAKGKIYSNKGFSSDILVNTTDFILNNSNLKIPHLQGYFKNSPFISTFDISKIFNSDRIINGDLKIQDFNISSINDAKLKNFLPSKLSKLFANCKNITGNIDLSAKIKNNSINAYTVLDDISFFYAPKRLKMSVKSGNLTLHNNTLNINKINARLGEMPIFIDGNAYNIYKNPYLNLYMNAKPTQDFFDQFFNNKALYPIKIKGDIIFSSKISGTDDNLNTRSELKVEENSSIYYMGSSIGDVENPVEISIDNTFTPNGLRVNNLQYDKIINSQNNKPFVTPQLTASGYLQFLPKNNLAFHNFKIKTQTPTDAKIFNIIFKKPIMKQGVFTSDLVLNGTTTYPNVKGKLDITSIDMPFFDSTVKDINLHFTKDDIYITTRGVFLSNDVIFNAVMKNKLVQPFVFKSAKVNLADLDINKIIDSLRDFETDTYKSNTLTNSSASVPFDLSQIIIQKAEITADKIKVRNISANNFVATLNINEKMRLSVDKFKFNIAEGKVIGSMRYNLLNHVVNLDLHLDKANSQMMSEALFDLKNQVYGSVNGDINLTCNGKTHDKCFRTLSGEGYFKIANGKMPKLGSLEYLLKASNLLRGGVTGISINSLIDIITPLKTGEFASISGDFHISNGIAQRMNIYSDGKDLNMYLTGSYNFVNSIADMQIFGSLSKNITSVFGKVKNASLNTLFNTIPGMNSSDKTLYLQSEISKIPSIKNATNIYRIFAVDVYGDINGDNYVQSFKWVK